MATSEQNTDRIEDILEAACQVISRTGSRALRMQDVARQAKVSKALVHYYFKTREELLARAYSHVEAKGRSKVIAEMRPLERGATRLKRLFLFYFDDEVANRQEWVVWSELSAIAMFDADLRPIMEASFRNWIAWIERTIQDGISDGSIPKQVAPSDAAVRLTALIDGLGSAFVRGLVDRSQAREALAQGLALELGITAEASPAAPVEKDRPSPAYYFQQLADLTKMAVGELGRFAASETEASSIRSVCALIDRMTGNGLAASDSQDRSPRRSQRRAGRRPAGGAVAPS